VFSFESLNTITLRIRLDLFMTTCIDISVIVPVFNVEPYLARCLDSLANQTYRNIEVILIYDDSTDESLRICQRYAKVYKNFFLFHGNNNGAGAARNYGLKHSKGRFICFVDSDDWIEHNLCSDVLATLDASESEFVNFGFEFINVAGKVISKKRKFTKSALLGENIFFNAMLDLDVYSVPWNKMYRRSFLIEHQVNFPEVKEWEDVLFSRKVAYYAKRTSFVSKVYYHALVREDSRSRNISSSFLTDGLRLLEIERQFISDRGDNNKYSALFKAHFIKHLSFFLIKAAFQVKSNIEYIRCCEIVYKSQYCEYVRDTEVRNYLPIKNRMMLMICNYPAVLRKVAFLAQSIGFRPY